MNKVWIFLLCSLISITTIYAKGKIFVYTYPRSGTNFLCYSLGHILGRSHYIERAHGSLHYFEMCKLRRRVPSIEPSRDYLILCLRNYKECMLSNFPENTQKIFSLLIDDSNDHVSRRYFQNLKEFDEWPSNRRLLIYYEDLMKEPSKVFRRICHFFNGDKKDLVKYLSNLSYHKQRCLNSYNKNYGNTKFSGSYSKGKDVLYHSKRNEKQDLLKMDQLAFDRSPYLYKKYLERYKEQNL